jgi:inosine/xanthosine triphosphate pyrophosphatase family protein
VVYEKTLLMTANEGKINEFKELMDGLVGFDRFKSPNEVKSQDPIEVIKHKTKDMFDMNKKGVLQYYNFVGNNTIIMVEDTSLMIEGFSVGTDIKYVVDHMEDYAGCKAEWNVYLGVTNGNSLEIYMGSIIGNLTKQGYGSSKFGFDKHFIPHDLEQDFNEDYLTLSQLQDIGKKHLFSARARAIHNFNKGNFIQKISLSEVPEWTGQYQEE